MERIAPPYIPDLDSWVTRGRYMFNSARKLNLFETSGKLLVPASVIRRLAKMIAATGCTEEVSVIVATQLAEELGVWTLVIRPDRAHSGENIRCFDDGVVAMQALHSMRMVESSAILLRPDGTEHQTL